MACLELVFMAGFMASLRACFGPFCGHFICHIWP